VLYAVLTAAVVTLVMTAWPAGSLGTLAQCAVILVTFAGVWCWLRANRRMLADGKPLPSVRG
jgi:hypothetical protein